MSEDEAPSGNSSERVVARGRERSRPHTTTSGALLTSTAAPVGIVHGTLAPWQEAPLWLKAVGVVVSLLLFVSGGIITRYPRQGRMVGTLGLLGGFGLAVPYLATEPLFALLALIAITATLVLLWKIGAPLIELSRVRRRAIREGQAQGAGIASVLLWLFWTFTGAGGSLVDVLAVGWALLCSTLLAFDWAVHRLSAHRARATAQLASVLVPCLLVPVLWGSWWSALHLFLVPALVATVVVRQEPRREIWQGSWWELLLGHPERLFVGTFAVLCLIGTVLLALPQSSASGQSIGLQNAAFTSTSAVCVTGLIVLDTPTDFSVFGQSVILLLIQVGGLGVMTFSTAALWVLGQRISLRHEAAVARLLSARDRGRLFATAKRILQLTVVAEASGALLLSAAFVAQGDSFLVAVWRGVFTAISAFCNAGFALQSDSLIPYQQAPFILHTVGALVVVGGLSPLVVFALPSVVWRSSAPVPVQARIALNASGILLVVGFLFFLTFEWNGSLQELGALDKLHNAWFQSVTLRTAGFNSVDLSVVHSATLVLTLVWMFIGGSPGGTAGGVKTTTISVLALSVVQAIRGQLALEVFGRRISETTRARATVVIAVAATTGLWALVAVLLTQNMPARLAVFEVVSALGTVGLSIGGTAALDGIGKVIVIMCMFIGRVGGLTLLMFLSSRRAHPRLVRPEEEMDVG